MIASGWWHQPFSANAQNGANYPVGEAGILTVHAPTSSMIYQTYRGYAAGGLYWRCRYNGTWGGWFRAWDSGNFNPANYVAKSEYNWSSLPGSRQPSRRQGITMTLARLPPASCRWLEAALGRTMPRRRVATSEPAPSPQHPWEQAVGGGTTIRVTSGNGAG